MLKIVFPLFLLLVSLQESCAGVASLPQGCEQAIYTFINSFKGEQVSDLQAANKFLQAHFLRPKGSERWDIAQWKQQKANDPVFTEFFARGASIKRAALEKLNCFTSAQKPKKKNYDAVFLLGSTAQNMEARIKFFQESFHDTSKDFYVLTGQRKLTEKEKKYLRTIDSKASCETETDAARILVEKAGVVDAKYVDTPKGAEEKRPNTADTVEEWRRKYGEDVSSILAISSAPHIYYQNAVLENLLPETTTVETIGGAYTNEELDYSLLVVLDAIARTVFEVTK